MRFAGPRKHGTVARDDQFFSGFMGKKGEELRETKEDGTGIWDRFGFLKLITRHCS
jgi:hypothetical protein